MQETDDEAHEVEAEVDRVISAKLAEYATTISAPVSNDRVLRIRYKLGDLE